MKKLKFEANKFYKLFLETLSNPVMQILPGQIAFFFVLSIFPIILILSIIAPVFSISMKNIAAVITASLPAETSKVIIPLLTGKSIDINIIFLIISAIFLISKCTRSIIVASSVVYKVDEHYFLKNRIKSVIITILLVLLFMFIAVISVFGGKILTFISKIIYMDENIINIYNLFRWPITFFVIFFVVKIVYTLAPNKNISSKDVNLGALITTISWVILTIIYSYYITHFSKYNLFYGSAANLIILLLWIYLISYIFVFGMVINVSRSNFIDNKKKCK